MSTLRTVALASLVVLSPAAPARALFHFAVIDEVMSGAGGNPRVQYVEIRMTDAGQVVIANTRLTAFDCDGTVATVLLLVPGPNLTNGTEGARWILASPDGATFLAASGISPDRVWDSSVAGDIPTGCGMVCWGAPGAVPPNPPTWDAANPDNYVDCVAYGPYTGPLPTGAGAPAAATPGDGTLGLTRIGPAENDNGFALACPSPTNNANETGGFGPCTPPTTTTTAPAGTTTTTAPPGAGQLVSGSRFVLKTPRNPARHALSVSANDAALTLGDGRGSADDPTLYGGTLRLASGILGGFDVTYELPKERWRAIGRRGWVFRSRARDGNAIRRVLVRVTRRGIVRVKGAGEELAPTLGQNPNPVAVVLTLGAERYCMQFGGEVRFRENRRFVARDAPRPASCPP